MVPTKCQHCGRTVPGAKRKCPRCGSLIRRKASFWQQFGVSGCCYILILISGLYLVGSAQSWGWVIVAAGVLLLGLRLLRITAIKQ